jgi:hypothetical protein
VQIRSKEEREGQRKEHRAEHRSDIVLVRTEHPISFVTVLKQRSQYTVSTVIEYDGLVIKGSYVQS